MKRKNESLNERDDQKSKSEFVQKSKKRKTSPPGEDGSNPEKPLSCNKRSNQQVTPSFAEQSSKRRVRMIVPLDDQEQKFNKIKFETQVAHCFEKALRRQSEKKLSPSTVTQRLCKQKKSQATLLNFIATFASDGVINVSYDRFEYDLLQELSKETLHDYDDCSFLAKINFKASYLNIEKVKDLKKTDIRDLIQSNFHKAFQDLLQIVGNFDKSSEPLTKKSVLSIITSVTSNIILAEKVFISEDTQRKFNEFFTILEGKIRKIMKKQSLKKRQSKARKSSLLLSSLILLLAGCDSPIFLNQADYVPKFSVKDPKVDSKIFHMNGEYEASYLKKFKGGRKFQPNDFPRKLKTGDPEELWSYYRSVTLDNMLILFDSSSSSNLDPFPSNGTMVKNATHYKSMLDAIQRIKDILERRSLESCAKDIKEIIEDIIAPIHDVKGVQGSFRQTETNFASTPCEYDKFYENLAERISDYQSHDIIETLARIDYD
eukprot:gene2778-2959_t